MKIEGKVIKVLPVESGMSNSGKEWKKMLFVIEYEDGNNKTSAAFSVMGDGVDKIIKLSPGMFVEVDFKMESREYNGKWYTDLKSWKVVEKKSQTSDLPF